MSLEQYLQTDDLTVLLGLIAVTVFLLHNLYKPQPLVHPILLGRQSDVGRVRNPKESALYRNYGTGLMGRFAVKPEKDINMIFDLLKAEFDAPRTLWSTKISNTQLRARISAFGSGLVKHAGLVPHESNVLLLLNDSLEFLISDFALASHSIPSFTVTAPSLLSPVLETHPPSAIITNAKFLPHVLELIYDSNESEHHTVIVVGDFDPKAVSKAGNILKVLKWADVESKGSTGAVTITTPSPEEVFTVSFFSSETGRLQGAHLTHANFTAGVAATRALLPLTNGISALDTIVSAHSLSSAYGRVIAYTALFEGSSFATLESTSLFHMEEKTLLHDLRDILSATSLPIPSPTFLFIKPGHLESLSSSIITEAKKSVVLYSFAHRHKLAGITEGFISKDSLWDRLVFENARRTVMGNTASTVRGIVVTGGPVEATSLIPSRIALSLPLVIAHVHPLAVGPIFASHPLDLQLFPVPSDAFGQIAHVGPPSVNVEAKLVDVDDATVEAGSDPIGQLMIRGPTVGKVLGVGDESYIEIPSATTEEGWVGTGETARVLTNGAFKVLPRKK